MQITPDQAVGEIAAAYPETVRVFELKGIDYCCGGKGTLASVCQAKELDPAELIRKLRKVVDKSPGRQGKWIDVTLSELIQHILDKHHLSAGLRR